MLRGTVGAKLFHSLVRHSKGGFISAFIAGKL